MQFFSRNGRGIGRKAGINCGKFSGQISYDRELVDRGLWVDAYPPISAPATEIREDIARACSSISFERFGLCDRRCSTGRVHTAQK